MTKVSRSNEFVREEKGGDWFQEYLRILAGQPSTATEIVRAKETVADVIANYKEQTGLNLISQASEEEQPKLNESGGYEYLEKDLDRAKKADLIILPDEVEGTNCANCKYVEVLNTKKGLGFCKHPDIQLPVTARMCCALWDNAKVERQWENKTASVRKISKRIVNGISPIAPMKLKKLKSPDDMLKNYDDSDIIVQMKLDGFKTQAINEDNKPRLYTRRGEEFTENVPDLIKGLASTLPSGTFVLGELVWEDSKGKQSISDIQTVVGSSPEKAHEKIKEGKGKPVFYVYDILWSKGKDITKKPYEERYDILKGLTKGAKGDIRLVKNYTYAQKDEAINTALKVNAEGIVLKPKNSTYEYGKVGSNEPVGEWAKFKPGAKAKTDEVVLNKYNKAEDKLVFPMYQYKDSELFEVGKLSGMSKEDEAKIKKVIDSGKSVVVEISFQERMPSGKFRHAGWSRFRPDKPAKEVKYSKASISVRHASKQDIVALIESKPELKNAIDSFCRHSHGTKNTYSIINFLREKLRDSDIRYSNQDLYNYIEECKKAYQNDMTNDDHVEVGLVGLRNIDEYKDNVADYISHGER